MGWRFLMSEVPLYLVEELPSGDVVRVSVEGRCQPRQPRQLRECLLGGVCISMTPAQVLSATLTFADVSSAPNSYLLTLRVCPTGCC